MRLSIRNRLAATVQAVTTGPTMTTVVARLAGGQRVTAAITSDAADDLDLQRGQAVEVLIKSTEVSVALDDVGRMSIRNLFPGIVAAVDHGEVMTTVKIEIAGDDLLTAAITRESAEELGLQPGVAVTAMIKSTDVAVGVSAPTDGAVNLGAGA